MIGTLLVLLFFIAAVSLYHPSLYAIGLKFPLWFKIFMGLAWLGGTFNEYRSWRACQKSKHAV